MVLDKMQKFRLDAPWSQDRLKEILSYDPVTGIFRWKISHSNGVKIGDAAGTPCVGYVRIHIDRRGFLAHILAWLYMTGKVRIRGVDHHDLNRSNNKWSNLRAATISQNHANKRVLEKNKLKTKGVVKVITKKGTVRYRATLTHKEKQYHLGYFSTVGDAHLAYVAAAKKFHGEFARFE